MKKERRRIKRREKERLANMNGTSPESQTNGRPAGPGFGDGKLKRADELEDVSYVRKKRRRKKKRERKEKRRPLPRKKKKNVKYL